VNAGKQIQAQTCNNYVAFHPAIDLCSKLPLICRIRHIFARWDFSRL